MPEPRLISVFGREFKIQADDVVEWKFTRILSKIDFDAPGGCWRWTGSTKAAGYGGIVLSSGTTILAHRYIWHVLRGPLPKHLLLHHKCENKACVNPDHLQPVTPFEHLTLTPQHIMHAGRWEGPNCPKGHPLEGNLYVSAKGHRRCKTCYGEWKARRQQLLDERATRTIKTRATHCIHGHEFTPENTYTFRGLRFCVTCHSATTKRQYHEKKAAQGISTSPFVRFEDKTECKNGHDLTNPANILTYKSKGVEKRICGVCHAIASTKSYEKRKLAHINDPKPLRRKPGPKPRVAVQA